MLRIENWSLTKRLDSLTKKYFPTLYGNVYDHPDHKDGTALLTTKVLNFRYSEGYALTTKFKYKLGTISESWKEWVNESGYTIEEYEQAFRKKL